MALCTNAIIRDIETGQRHVLTLTPDGEYYDVAMRKNTDLAVRVQIEDGAMVVYIYGDHYKETQDPIRVVVTENVEKFVEENSKEEN